MLVNMSQINEMTNDKETSLLRRNGKKIIYSRDKANEEIFVKIIEEVAKKTILQQKKHDDLYKPKYECEIRRLEHQCIAEMKAITENNIKPFPLSPRSEEAIEMLIPMNLKKKYKSIHQGNMEKIRLKYSKIMFEFAMKTLFRKDCGCEWTFGDIPDFKFLGRTKNYKKYEENRKLLSRKFPLHIPVMQIILKSRMLLPKLICDFKNYSTSDYLQLSRLGASVFKDMQKVKFSLSRYFLQMEKTVFLLYVRRDSYGIPANAREKILNVASKAIAIEIAQLIMNTVDQMINDLSNELHFPQLLLRSALSLKSKCVEIKCISNYLIHSLELQGKDLTISPEIVQIYEMFYSFLNEIINISPDAIHLKLPRQLEVPGYFVCDALPHNYQTISRLSLQKVLDSAFNSLKNYVTDLRKKFKTIYDMDFFYSRISSINNDLKHDILISKIQEYNAILHDVYGMTRNVYFSIGKLNQQNAKDSLENHTNNLRKLVVQQMTKYHYDFNVDICESFKALEHQALHEIPNDTEELMEYGETMLYAKTTLMAEFKEKIYESLQMLIMLMEMITLNEEHLELNMNTVNWLTKIQDVFEKNGAKFEQKKFDLEDRLKTETTKLNDQIENMFPRLTIMYTMGDASELFNYLKVMRQFVKEFNEMNSKVEWINKEEKLLKFTQSGYPKIDELKEFLMPFYELLYKCKLWQRYFGVWLDGPFEYLDAKDIENKTTDFFTDFSKIGKTYKSKIKINTATGYPYTFIGSVDDPDPYKQPAPMKLCHQMLEQIKWFKEYIPLVHCFCNPTLLQHHWDEMSKIAGFDMTPNAGTTLRKIINMDLMADFVNFEIISISASKEHALKELYYKLYHEWDTVNFVTMPYKDSNVDILAQIDDTQALLEEQIVKVQAMRGSAFVKRIQDKVQTFYEQLLRIQDTIKEWTSVQMQWMYLLPIFSSKDIVAQLPEEGILFSEVDSTFRKTMFNVSKNPNVRDIAGSVGLCETMKDSNEKMEKVNDGVSNYLEKKRLAFPRFFFLSNDDMLSILSETKDPLRVQPHLKKCFEGIAKLGFNNQLEIFSMYSDDKEEVLFTELISTSEARGCVEKWLIQVEDQMLKSVKSEIQKSYYDYDQTPRVQWVLNWPGMVILCVSQIYWSMEVHSCLRIHKSELQNYYTKLKSQILNMVHLVKTKMSNQNRTTLNALITIDVHAQDVVKLLIDKNVVHDNDFEWLAQLRYYWEGDVFVRIINSTVSYAYEYLGNCPRLVITPLTDRTLIGAYSLHLNGAPEGPAGTGKTETTKDLARAIAVQCVVFNCSEDLDYKNMGKFFKGLASCGAWACFDEFNRIELEVLSVVAQQILCIVQAVRAKLKKFIFEGTELTLDPAVYICITMNPGYAGRSELPDNLKVLFRTVAMMVPDYAMIGEIFLYSSGFSTARVLSVKIVTTYKLCSEQLSTQRHYDYGMRAVKSVLTAAQNLKFKFPDEDETILLLRSIIDVNLPKFLAYDVPLFEGIVSDLFPGVTLPSSDYSELLKAVEVIVKKHNLQMVDGFTLKIIQTYEMMKVRHGFMLVGDPLGGKTTVLRTLAESLTLLKEWGSPIGVITKFTTFNPKAVTMGQLYGQFDPVSSEWKDGVCAVAFRKFCAEETTDRKWLIFDGPIDAAWIENLNTVLDDNKKLCLTSGEVIQMTNEMSMIFEAMDVLQASPATVSRCGMIYLEPQILGYRPFLKSWIEDTNSNWKVDNLETLRLLLNWIMEPCLEFIRKKCRLTLNAGQISQVVSTLEIIKMHIDEAIEASPEDYEDFIFSWIQAATMISITWGAGGALDHESRIMFNEYHCQIWKNENADFPVPETFLEQIISLPSEGLIHDNFYTFKGKGAWKYYGEIVRSEKIIETQSIGQMVVPTIDTLKYQSMFLRHIKFRKRFLLYGESGTGKSFYIQDLMMNKLDEKYYLPNFISFTTKITAAQTQELILSKLFQKRRGQFSTMEGQVCIVFIDDVNMPVKEIYGAQPPIELLRQLFDHSHWYDLKEPQKLEVLNTMFVCAMAPPGGSRQVIYKRFLRHFNLFSISSFSTESIMRIFTNLAMMSLKRNGFASDVLPTVNKIVNATIEIYSSAIRDLRPIPIKSHYLFNLRDLSRVITGCSLIKKDSIESKSTFIRLWVHETRRVFGDRLIDDQDRNWLFEQLKEITLNVFKEPFDFIFGDLSKFEDKLTHESLQSLIFGSFMDTDALAEDRKYEEIKSIEEYEKVAKLYLEEYNLAHKKKMDIVLFRYALIHLAKICRVLVIPSGSLLMVGIGGSGRQSLTRLAAHILDYGIFQPEIGSAYELNEWREDIKKVLINSGGTGKDLVFLFTEGQVKDEVFLEDIDSLLRSGEVPNLYNIEEKQQIIEMTRLAAQGGQRNLDISILAVLAYFVNRCKEKLHLMLCFSPVGESFRIRLRNYPNLVNCCTIDWFEVWPEDALEQVAVRFTTHINVTEKIKKDSIIACKYFHICAKENSIRFYETTSRKTYITTAAFLDLICTFRDLMSEKQEELTLARDRYLNGLDKLEYAAEQIAKLRENLSALRPQLERSANKAAETMRKIEYENETVKQATMLVRKEEDAANKQAEIAGALKAECEADLAKALPILEDALAALNILKPADITLVKSMKNPPESIKLVMAAVCVMLSISPNRVTDPRTGKIVLDYWTPSQRILSDMKFLDSLREYDKDNISPHVIKEIKTVYLTHKDFVPKVVAKASQAAKGLCKWVRAMVLYDKVAKEVAPKKTKLMVVESAYQQIMAVLTEKRKILQDLNEKLEVLKNTLVVTLEKKIELENLANNCKNKLTRAEKLINGLGGEKDRWTTTASNLRSAYESLPGDILVSCAVIAYLAPFTREYRFDNIDKWKHYVKNLNIPTSDDFNFITVLGSEIEINTWNIHNLPTDTFSTENAIIMKNTKRWSLFIDPQSQANRWIRSLEKSRALEVVKLTDKNYMYILEQCIENGKPVLIENVGEELDVSLDPILMKNIYKDGQTWFITLGEKTIEYDLRFQLYITTKLRNPHYLPEIFNKVTLINFALTIDGLEDQLLGIVVAKERPDLREEREQLIIQGAANKKALKNVEDEILKTLAVAGDAILDDEEAIEILDSSKVLSTDIIRKQEASKTTEARIETFRHSYMPIAVHSAALYYTLTDLPNIDPMYQFSLTWFINLYVISIEQANRSTILQRRLDFLRKTFTYNLYRNVCRSLFEKDKILYSFVLYCTILLTNKELSYEELNFFITGGLAIGSAPKNPASDWLPDTSWNEIFRAENLPFFSGFVQSFSQNLNEWKHFYDAVEPQKLSIPEPWEKNLTNFQKLIIMRMIRPDKIISKMMQFVEGGMGTQFITPPSFNLAESFKDSNSMIPLVFVLSPGSDPMSALFSFAENMNYQNKFYSISLGQGQGPIAEALIERAKMEGCWVCLQNCHLAVSWMPMLEKIYELFDPSNTSTDFRLWLTSYPSDKFPITILQNGVKMTNEPPTGLKQNLLKTYTSEPVKDPEFFSGCPGKEKEFTKLLYGLCFFHAIVQERRNYGPQGWNIKYGFNESDFQISVQQLQIFINDYEEVPFKAITYLTGECNYGGRVTDDRDRRCLITILQNFYNKEVITNSNYAFSNVGPEYALPKKYGYENYLNKIMSIPLTQPPEVFGFHMNAGISRDLDISKEFFDAMLKIQGSGQVGDTSKQDELLLKIKDNIYNKLPGLFDIELVQIKYPVSYSESMNTVLLQEMERFNTLLDEIKTSLILLEKAVKGLIVMTPDLEILSNYLLNNKVPPSWEKASAYPSLKPLSSFIADFIKRLEFFQKWYNEGKPATFWISGFSFIHGFLTGATQNFARKYRISIDKIDFEYEVLNKYQPDIPPEDGIYAYGLYLVGARWDLKKMMLAESIPKILWDAMPLIWFKPCELSKKTIGKRYECPLYITSARFGTLKTTGHSTNYILSILLETDVSVSHWIQRGLALLCQLDN